MASSDPCTVRLITSEADRAAVYRIRELVFQQEQAVPLEIERDAYDETAMHFLAEIGAEAVGTARAVDKGDGNVKVGRVATLPEWRGHGVGAAIMQGVLETLRERGFRLVILDAQTPVLGFYERLGFVAEGLEFYEAAIPHRRMTIAL